jgi:hypothetical protein
MQWRSRPTSFRSVRSVQMAQIAPIIMKSLAQRERSTMTTQVWLEWIPTIISILMALGIFIGRNWLKARIERSVQHTFDAKLETIRTDLRGTEERLKSELRVKESEISALRDVVLSGRAQRQALLDKRRLDAVEHVWAAVMDLTPYRTVAAMMASVNLKAAVKEAPRHAGMRKFAEIIATLPAGFKLENVARSERPFVSPMAWAYFSAFQAVLLVIYSQVKALEIGLEESDKFINLDNLRKMLKNVLPHQAPFIDEYDLTSYHFLIDELEDCILNELTKMLDGEDGDQASIIRSAAIMKDLKSVIDDLDSAPASVDGVPAR